uniref:sushi, von Willebrand factor type A, EGF and pentraxin domain-containing protein 1-like n=1 Tax=Styela clava TaxID=7725 RepID=UPI00193A5EDF|nr:sushi, von Willebrand factor type A, EGF and pentraxin domain-containing protein 1-like [Styela clava]
MIFRLLVCYILSYTLLHLDKVASTTCGRSLNKIVSSRVVGGKEAKEGDWPWQAVFVKNPHRLVSQIRPRNMFGGGSVINSKWVLTAGHVFDGPFAKSLVTNDWKGFLVILGMTKYPERVQSLAKETVLFEPEMVIRHDKYKPSTYEYDVALIKFGKALHEVRRRLVPLTTLIEIPFDGDVRPVCLPCYNACGTTEENNNKFSPELCDRFEKNTVIAERSKSSTAQSFVTGFGSVVARDPMSTNYQYPKSLQQAELAVFDDESCDDAVKMINEIYNSVGHKVVATYTKQMLCAAGARNISDACQGDSGGPLVRMTRFSIDEVCWTQIGIVSWGLGCASNSTNGTVLPGYYTNVAVLMGWIAEKIGLSASSKPTSIAATLVHEEDIDTRGRSLPKANCPKPFKIENGQVREFNTERAIGSVIKYSCDNDFMLSGNSTVVCGPNAKWGTAPICEEIMCPQPIVPDNGKIVGDVFTSGSRVLFECNDGFILHGISSSTCGSNGKWTESIWTCKEIICPEPEALEHGKVFKSDNFKYMSQIVYQCNSGYILRGNSISVCNEKGEWNGSRICEAQNMSCPKPGTLINGKIVGNRLDTGGVLVFGCNPGYNLIGRHFSVCSNLGKWGPFPVCKEKACDAIVTLKNGNVIGNNYSIGSSLKFTCNVGFVLDGSEEATCLESSQWNRIPTCDRRPNCISPEAPKNGGIRSPKKVYQIGRYVIYYCERGFELIGSFWARCLNTHEFSSPPPQCRRQQTTCPKPPTLTNGIVEDGGKTHFAVGSSISFSCNEGYFLSGNSSVACGKEGKWGNYPSCEAVTGCDRPKLEREVFILKPRDFYLTGQYVEFGCPPGYILKGSKYSGCESSGQFLPPSPVCIIGRTSCVTGCYYEEEAACQCHELCVFTGDCCSDHFLFCQSRNSKR